MKELNLAQLEIIRAKARLLPERASLLSVHSNATLTRANEFVKGIKLMMKEYDNLYDESIDELRQAKKGLLDKKKADYEPLVSAEAIAKAEINRHLDILDKKEMEAKKKAREIEEEKFRQARELEAKGRKEEAEALREEDTAIMEVPETPKLEGSHRKKIWDFEVTDENEVPRRYLMLDRVKIGKEVREKKEKTNIPGIRAFPRPVFATRLK